MKDCLVKTYNVRQGLFNLLVGLTDTNCKYAAIFDCGNFEEYGELNSTIDASELLNGGMYTCFDTVVISHQDEDHWRKFLELMKKLNPPDSSLWLKKK